MNRRIVVLCAVAFSAAVAVAVATAGGTRTSCTPGVRVVDGLRSRVFCGPATATLRVGGKEYTFRNGACERKPLYFDVNIGVVSLVPGKKGHTTYFGLVVGRAPGFGPSVPAAGKDGSYSGATIAIDVKGTGYALRSDSILKLRNGRTAGSFAGKTFDGKAVTGTFRCG